MKASAAESGVIPVPNLQEFFRNSVEAAILANRLAIEMQTVHYVVNLLTLFVRSEALHDPADAGPGPRPLALMLADAAEATTEEGRNAALRRLGDVALFVAGFLAEGLHHRTVGVGYYVRMGGSAYGTLATVLPANPRGRAFAGVFAELSRKFADVVDILNEVLGDARYAADGGGDRNVLRLYETWLATGSQRSARLLRQLGIEPGRQPGLSREH